jgi:hypothetical protein
MVIEERLPSHPSLREATGSNKSIVMPDPKSLTRLSPIVVTEGMGEGLPWRKDCRAFHVLHFFKRGHLSPSLNSSSEAVEAVKLPMTP